MKDKTRNILIIISVCVILIIFTDLIFNFSRLFIENFQSNIDESIANAGAQAQQQSETENNDESESLNIRSIIPYF